MTEFFEFATSGFWIFLGCAILLSIGARAFVAVALLVVAGFGGPRKDR